MNYVLSYLLGVVAGGVLIALIWAAFRDGKNGDR